jgi:hypothetical protein
MITEETVQPVLVRTSTNGEYIFIVFNNNDELITWFQQNALDPDTLSNTNFTICNYVGKDNCLKLKL